MEILNHSIVTKEITQLLGLSDKIECFKSDTIGNGKLYVGSEAPSAFRSGTKKLHDAKDPSAGMKITTKSGDNTNAVFVSTLLVGYKKKETTFAVGLKNNNLIYFVESAT
jgi:hypothetical protein